MGKVWKNEKLLSKAAITTGSFTGGIGLSIEEADRFIDFVVDESRLKDTVRIERFNASEKQIDKLFLSDSKPLKPATENVPGTENVDTSTTRITLTGKEMIAIVQISDNSLEDNLEGDAFADHVLGMVARASSNQIEAALLEGRKSATGTDTDIRQLWDGWLKLAATGGHVTDADGAGFSDRFISTEKLSAQMKSLPTKWRSPRRELRNYMADDIELDYSDILSARGTGLGDRQVLGDAPLTYRSVPLTPLALMSTEKPVLVSGAATDTLDGATAVGNTDFTVDSSAGFTVGDEIAIDRDGPNEEVLVIDSIPDGTSIGTTTGAEFAHLDGETVEEVTSDGTSALLSRPMNLIWGIKRDVRIELDRLPKQRATDWVITMRMDANMENPDASAILKNLKVK